MSAWLRRFSLHLAAAIGATSLFVGAAAVGAHQTRQQAATIGPAASPSPGPRRKPTVIVASPAASLDAAQTAPSPTAVPAGAAPGAAAASPPPTQPRRTATPARIIPERSLSGTIVAVLPDGLTVHGVGGREWRVTPVPGALIRLNGKSVHLDALHVGDALVILGQALGPDGQRLRFLAHAITTRRK